MDGPHVVDPAVPRWIASHVRYQEQSSPLDEYEMYLAIGQSILACTAQLRQLVSP